MAIHFFAGFYGIAGIFIKDSVKNMCVNSADSALFCFFTVKWIASSVRKDFLAMTREGEGLWGVWRDKS